MVIALMLIGSGTCAALGCYVLWRYESIIKWADRYISPCLDKTIGKLFEKSIGKWVDNSALEESIETNNLEDTLRISKRYGLEEKTLQMCESRGKLLHGARFAREIGNKYTADDFYRKEFQRLKDSQPVHATEVAEEAGFLQEAYEIYVRFDNRVGYEKAMKLAEKLGKYDIAKIIRRELGLSDYSDRKPHFGKELTATDKSKV